MTVTAYQYRDNSLYVQASRGYNTENVVKPDFAAPGVDILTASIGAGAEFAPATGTSLAAAQTAGMVTDSGKRALLYRKQRKKLPEQRRGPRSESDLP